ncbi:glycosyltransferase family 2 protein [Ahniella affigens]|uniref:Glycosyltransferase family 2 protein n=1 Tax=Ahniella affigens TaxID=2021234 RepID=A0A2P1PS80_9GAMM|nr:glycosyltransferase family 2 protein [Ahniella affigens]AVP97682.1 glycosyltransferase family 2 protein [Ahniella affigens]
MRQPLSVVVTTLNNADTLPALLESVRFADEVYVLDSGSTDQTLELLLAAGARIGSQPFQGYGPQKAAAINAASHDWVLLLDADEAVTPALAAQIQATLMAPMCDAYRIARRERMFWQWQHPGSKHNRHLRLFDRRLISMSNDPIHAAPESRGRIGLIDAPILHWGEPDLYRKVEKINRYSSGMAAARLERASALLPLRLVFYPPLVLLKQLIVKRQLLNGWAGWINAVSLSYYAFLKDAKVLELQRQKATSAPSDQP